MGNIDRPSNRTSQGNVILIGKRRVMEVLSKISFEMQSHAKKIVFVIALMFSVLAALQNGTKSKKLDPPSRFFAASSLVIDYPYGNMVLLRSRINEQEISFIMFYAPWDAESIHAKDEFEAAARFYHNQVFFVAINCWWNEGECRELQKFKSFPIFVAHLAHGSISIQFKAPITSENMIAFLNHVLKPYKPIHSKDSLINLQAKHQSVFINYFNFSSSPQPPGFTQYIKSAYSYLEDDPFQETCFGLITNASLARELRVLSSPRLFLWNTSKKYPYTKIQADIVSTWLKRNVRNLVNWISISGLKSTTLWDQVQKRPSLILFTPRNHLLNYSPYFTLLKYLMNHYMSCKLNPDQMKLLKKMKNSIRTDYYKFKNLHHWCSGADNRETTLNCHSYYEMDKSSRCSICLPCKSGPNFTHCVRDGLNAMTHIKTGSCSSTYDDHLSRLNIMCGNKFQLYSDHSSIKDDKMKDLLTSHQQTNCKLLKYFHFSKSVPSFFDASYEFEDDISSQGCTTNKSINVIALDSSSYGEFSLRLGVNVSAVKDQTAVVLLSSKDEVQYVLEKINLKTLVQFIKDFTSNNLIRHQRSFQPNICNKSNKGVICIDEVTTDNFSEVVINNTKDVVLMHYTNWCGFCAGIAHIYLSAAAYFSSNENILFARINGDYNDLPWHLTASRYPSIIIFPAYRKADSVEFPNTLQITETNLIQFVLYHVQKSVQRSLIIEKCSEKCLQSNYADALKKTLAFSVEIKDIKQKINRLMHSQSPTKRTRLKYLNDLLKKRTSDMEIAKHLIDVLPKVIQGERNKHDILAILKQ
ncbi:Thioredoxin domain-containing protein 11 [Nymphon striatum]|nr:Thioredoxin domain-containing protein 11 [Nymphon striatum]